MKLLCTGALCVVTEKETIAAGSANVFKAEFTFDSAWNGLTRTAMFKREGLAPLSQLLDENDECTIPWEAIIYPGFLQISCIGTVGENTILTTNYCRPQRIENGAGMQDAPDPSQTEMQQALAYMAASAQSAAQAAQSAEDARHQPVVGENGNWYTWDGENYVDTGDRAQGDAATIEVGEVTTGAPGTSAEVTNSGDANAAKFDFTIPRGDKGEKGDKGDKGDKGEQGNVICATFTYDSTTGELIMRTPDAYTDPIFYISDDGNLVVRIGE